MGLYLKDPPPRPWTPKDEGEGLQRLPVRDGVANQTHNMGSLSVRRRRERSLGPIAGHGSRAAVPVFPSAFLAGPGLLGLRRRSRPIGKGRANLVKSAARPDAGFKTFARWRTGAVLIAAMGLWWPSGANAFLITQIGTSGGVPGGLPEFEVSGLILNDAFNLTWGGVAGLSADGTVSITGLTPTAADISITINNTSTPITVVDPRITSFGISVENIDTGTPLSDTNTGGTFLMFASALNFPGFTMVDACGTSGTNCAGGGSGGIPVGGSDAFVLSVNGLSGGFIPSFTLDSFAIHIQGGPLDNNNDSYQLPGTPSVVPLPAALPLFLSALAGLGLIGWRRKRLAA